MPTNTETNNPSSDGPRTKRRKYVKRACKVCVAAKRSCSDGRPCERCVRLGKTHECIDESGGGQDMEESSYYRDPNVSLQHMATSSSTSSTFIMSPTMTYEQYQLQNELHQNMLQQHELQLQQLSMHQQHHHHHQSQEQVIGINSNGLGSTGTFSQGIVSVGGTIPWSMASNGSPEQLMMHSSYPTSSSSSSSTYLSAPGQQQQQYQVSDLIASTTTSSHYKSRGGNTSSAIKKTSTKKSKQKSKDVIMTNHGQGRGGGGEGESVLEEDVNNHSESDESIRRAKGLSKRSRTISDIGGDEGDGLDEDKITHSNYDPTASLSSSGMISNLNQSGSHLYHHHQQQHIQKEKGQIHFQQGGVIGGKSPLLQHHPFYSSQVSTTSPHLRVQGVMDSPTLLGQSGYITLGSDQQQQPLQQQMRVSLQSMTSLGEQQGARIINIDEMNRGRGGDRLHVVEAHHIQDPDEEPNAVRRAKGLSRRARATSDASGLNDDDEEERGINTEDEDILPDSHLDVVDDRSAHISTVPNSGGLLINNRQRNPFSSQSIQNKHTSSEETSFGFSPVWRESNPGSALITVNGPNEAVPTQFQPQPTSGKGLFTTTNNVGRSIGGPSDFVLDGEKAIGIETTDFIESNTEQGQSLLTAVATAASTSSTLSTSLANGGKRASPLPTQGKHNLPIFLSQDGIAANGSSNTNNVERQKPEGVHFEFETIGNSHTVTATVLENCSSQSAQLSTLTEGMRPQVVGPRQSSLKGRGKSSLTLSGLPETDFERSLLSHLLNFEDITEDALATPTSRSENSSLSGDIGSATKKAAAAVSSLSDDININNLIVVGSVGSVGEGGLGGYGIGVEGGGKRGKGGKGYSGKGVTNTGGKGVLYSSTGSAVSHSSGVIDCGLMPLQESFMNTSMNPTVAALQAARYADREMITQLESKLSHLRGIAAHLAGEVINLTGKLVKARWGKAQADRDLLIAATILHGQFIKSESGKGIDEKQVGVQPTDSTVLSSEEGIGEGVSFIAVPGPKITSSIPRVLSDNHLSEASC